MTTVKLHNDLLTIEISTHGAELQSIRNNLTGQEYLWHGDPAFWGRRSPVLFPIVGAVWEGRFRMDGRVYEMGQHGFARDRDFSLIEGSPEDEAWFSLDADEASLLIYPRRFRLEIGYRLTGERIDVMWRVVNRDTQTMSFQIGAHPAFMLPGFSAADDVHGYLMFDGGPDFVRQLIEARGCVGTETAPVILDDQTMLPIAADTFARDAIILAGGRTRRVSLLDKERRPLLTLLSFRHSGGGVVVASGQECSVCLHRAVVGQGRFRRLRRRLRRPRLCQHPCRRSDIRDLLSDCHRQHLITIYYL